MAAQVTRAEPGLVKHRRVVRFLARTAAETEQVSGEPGPQGGLDGTPALPGGLRDPSPALDVSLLSNGEPGTRVTLACTSALHGLPRTLCTSQMRLRRLPAKRRALGPRRPRVHGPPQARRLTADET